MECRCPLLIDYEGPPPRLPRRAATLFAALGIAFSVLFLPPLLPRHAPGTLNVSLILSVIGISLTCGLIGYWCGVVICRSRRAQLRAEVRRQLPAHSK
jgi:hypothetical protein